MGEDTRYPLEGLSTRRRQQGDGLEDGQEGHEGAVEGQNGPEDEWKGHFGPVEGLNGLKEGAHGLEDGREGH